jgi:hypothetical protein
MRKYFVIGGKLLGVYLLYLSLTMLFGSLSYIVTFFNPQSDPFRKIVIINSLVSLIILLIFSFVLLFRTEWLADLVKLDKESEDFLKIKSEIILRGGIVLIGLYVFATNIGRFISTIYLQFAEANMGIDPVGTVPRGITASKDLITIGITIAFSLFLIFGSGIIEKIVQRKN